MRSETKFKETETLELKKKWGRGIELILSKEPQTTFKEVADMFVAVFKRKNIPEITGTTPKVVRKGGQK